MNERRSLKILMIIILQLTGLPFAFSANLNEESKILEVGYCRRLWDSETMNVQIKCHRGKIVGVIERTSGKKIESRSRVLVSLKKYKAFEDYVVNNGIVYLKSIRLLDNSMDEKLFNESYEKIPRMYSYVYEIYFIYNSIKYCYFVDDVGYAKDKRYLDVLKKINAMLNIETEINVFGNESKQ